MPAPTPSPTLSGALAQDIDGVRKHYKEAGWGDPGGMVAEDIVRLRAELNELHEKLSTLTHENKTLVSNLSMTEKAGEDIRKKNEQLLDQAKRWGSTPDSKHEEKEERRQVAAYLRNVADAIEGDRLDGITWEWRSGGYTIHSTIALKTPPHRKIDFSAATLEEVLKNS